MSVLTVMSVLCRNHVRRGALLLDAVGAALIAMMAFAPWQKTQEWGFVLFVYGLAACILPALATAVISASAASQRGEAFLLKAGRPAYYLGVLAAGLLMGLVWVAALGAALPFLTVTGAPAGWAGLLAGTVALNALLAAGLFTLLSPLCGGSKEMAVGILLVILGLNSAWFAERESVWLQRLEYLVPPLMANMKAATLSVAGVAPEAAPAAPAVLHSGIYFAVVMALGILRFGRREFSRS